MTASVLQERQTSASASASSIGLAFSSNVTAGSAMHACGSDGSSGTTYSWADNNSGSWTNREKEYDGGNNQGIGHGTADNPAAGATTVTLTFSGSTPANAILIREIGGVATTATDGHNGNVTTSVTTATCNATNANQPALISALAMVNTNTQTPVVGGGLSAGINAWTFGGGTNFACSGQQRVTSAASQAATFTCGSSDNIQIVMAIFDESGGGTAPTLGRVNTLLPGQRPGNNPPLRIFRQGVSAGGDITVALTGASAAFAAGTLLPNNSVALAGASAAFSAGALTPSTSVALTGAAATFTAGTLAPSTSVALTGASAIFSAGTLTPGNSLALTGQAATFSAGALSPAIDVVLLGASATFTAGNLTAPGDVTVALTGASATFTAGTLTPSGGDVVITVADTSGGVPGFVPGKKPRKRKGQPYMREGQVFGEEYPLAPNMGQIQPKRTTTKAKAARVSVEGLQDSDLHAIHALFMLMHDD